MDAPGGPAVTPKASHQFQTDSFLPYQACCCPLMTHVIILNLSLSKFCLYLQLITGPSLPAPGRHKDGHRQLGNVYFLIPYENQQDAPQCPVGAEFCRKRQEGPRGWGAGGRGDGSSGLHSSTSVTDGTVFAHSLESTTFPSSHLFLICSALEA